MGNAHDPIISSEGLSESPKRTDAGSTPQLQQQDYQTDAHTSAIGRKSHFMTLTLNQDKA